MKNKDELRDELSELAPFLAKRKGADEGFRVPKDYFRSLPDEVMKKVRPEAPSIMEPKRNWLDAVAEFFQASFQPKYALAYASVAILVVAGIYFLPPPENIETGLAAIPDEAIESYLSENIDAIGTDLLEAQFAEGETENLPGLEVGEMEEYLDDALDDFSLDELEELL